MCPQHFELLIIQLYPVLGLHVLGTCILSNAVVGLFLIQIKSLFGDEKTGSERLSNFPETVPDKLQSDDKAYLISTL